MDIVQIIEVGRYAIIFPANIAIIPSTVSQPRLFHQLLSHDFPRRGAVIASTGTTRLPKVPSSSDAISAVWTTKVNKYFGNPFPCVCLALPLALVLAPSSRCLPFDPSSILFSICLQCRSARFLQRSAVQPHHRPLHHLHNSRNSSKPPLPATTSTTQSTTTPSTVTTTNSLRWMGEARR